MLMMLLLSVPAVKLLSICTLALGTKTLPVPLALKSKSLLDLVVVIKLSSNKISSICVDCVTSKSCEIVYAPVADIFPV